MNTVEAIMGALNELRKAARYVRSAPGSAESRIAAARELLQELLTDDAEMGKLAAGKPARLLTQATRTTFTWCLHCGHLAVTGGVQFELTPQRGPRDCEHAVTTAVEFGGRK